MRILILSRAISCHGAGGLEKYTEFLAHGLSKLKDTDVHILTTRHPDNITISEKDNITIHYMENKKAGQYDFETLKLFHYHTKQLNKKYQFDVVHSQGFAGCLLEKNKAQKIIVSPHGTLFSETPMYKKYFSNLSVSNKIKVLWNNKKRIGFLPLYKRLLSIADVIHADSQFIKNELTTKYPLLSKKIKVIPLGIPESFHPLIEKNTARNRLNLGEEKPIFFAIGRHARYKGFDLIIKAVSILKNSNFEVLIGGAGKMTEEYKNLSEKLKLKNIKFLGKVSEEDLPYYYAAADFVIVPDILCPAFGLTALESLLQNTPVIASDSGALPEIITDEFGFLFKNNDAINLAKIIDKALIYLRDKEKSSSKPSFLNSQKNLRNSILNKFSFQKMTDEIIQMYIS